MRKAFNLLSLSASLAERVVREITERSLAASLAAARILINSTGEIPAAYQDAQTIQKSPEGSTQTNETVQGAPKIPEELEAEFKERAMTHKYIRGMLRSATDQNILHGWQGPHALGDYEPTTYSVTNKLLVPASRDVPYMLGYCELLAVAGIEPLYRDSEPDIYDSIQSPQQNNS